MSEPARDATTTSRTLTLDRVSIETNIHLSNRDTVSQIVQLGDCHVKSTETDGRFWLSSQLEIDKLIKTKHTFETKETRVQVAKPTMKRNTRGKMGDTGDNVSSSAKERLHHVSLEVATELSALIDVVSPPRGPDPGRVVSILVRTAHRPKHRTTKRVRFPTIYEEPDQEVLAETEAADAPTRTLVPTRKSLDEGCESVDVSTKSETLVPTKSFEDGCASLAESVDDDRCAFRAAASVDVSTSETLVPTRKSLDDGCASRPIWTVDVPTKSETLTRKIEVPMPHLLSPNRLWVRIPSTNAPRRVHWGQQSPRRHLHRLATIVEVKESATVTVRKQTIVLLGRHWSPLKTQ